MPAAADLLSRLTDPVIGARANANGHVVITRPPRGPRLSWPSVSASGALLSVACVLLAGLALAMGIVSWHAQFAFIFQAKHQHLASALEALGMDAGAVIFSVLGIALARLGRRAVIERALVCLCALGSCSMNLLGADLGSPRSVAVYVMPPLLFAAGSDRLIAVIRRSALGPREDDDSQRSAWHLGGRAALYLLRLTVAPPSTLRGARQALLDATPLPGSTPGGAIGQSRAVAAVAAAPRRQSQPRPGRPPGKQARLIELAADRHDLAAVPLSAVAGIAAQLAPEAALHPGTARRVLRGAVLAAQNAGEPS